MSATANSKYQATALLHQAGSPPAAEYQRANETFTNYVDRMFAKGLSPDIGSTESDAAYLTRLATYVPTPNFLNVYVPQATLALTSSYITGSTGNANISVGITASFVGGIFKGIIS